MFALFGTLDFFFLFLRTSKTIKKIIINVSLTDKLDVTSVRKAASARYQQGGEKIP